MSGFDPGDGEQRLRRLLSEAVEPIRPAPGAEARLLARVRAQDPGRKTLGGLLLSRWVALALSVAVGAGVAVGFGVTAGSGGGSRGQAAAAAPARSSAPTPQLQPQGPSNPDLSRQAAPVPNSAGADSASRNKYGLAAAFDLDGDGRTDVLSIDRGTLVAELSRAGLQAVRLPAIGPGARVLSVTTLDSQTGPVPVAFVRVSSRPGNAQDVVVSLVAGRLTVLHFPSGQALLTVDATHGYACEGALVVLPASEYIVSGDALAPSPEKVVRASARAGQASC